MPFPSIPANHRLALKSLAAENGGTLQNVLADFSKWNFATRPPIYLIRSPCSASDDGKYPGLGFVYFARALKPLRSETRSCCCAPTHARIRPCANLSRETTRIMKTDRLRYEFYKLLEYRVVPLFFWFFLATSAFHRKYWRFRSC